MTAMPSIFGYWSLRGLGQVPRLILEHVGEEYIDKRMNASTDMEQWQAMKKENKYGFAFPNLPFYVDGKVRLTQSAAIIKYLARKHGLAAKTEEETQQLEMLDGVLTDIRVGYGITVYSADQEEYDKKKMMFKDQMTNNFRLISEFLGKKKFVLGDRVSYVDFVIYDLFCLYEQFYPEVLEGRDNLVKLKGSIEKLPNVARYLQSDRFIKWPLNGPGAFWGGK